MTEGSRIEGGAEKPKQSLEQYLKEALKGLSGGAESEYWKYLQTKVHNPATHGLVELMLRQEERINRKTGTEEFTIHELRSCPPESRVADLIKGYYEQQGYSLNKEETTGPINMVFQRPNDEKKIYVGVTTSPGENGATVIVTSMAI